jgi:putative iron-only hydrogenase system regulator
MLTACLGRLAVFYFGVKREVKELDKRLGVIGIVVEDRQAAPQVNKILSEHAEMIIGRMGLPHREREVSVISLIVDGTTDQVGSLTGKLGNIPQVIVKSALTKA